MGICSTYDEMMLFHVVAAESKCVKIVVEVVTKEEGHEWQSSDEETRGGDDDSVETRFAAAERAAEDLYRDSYGISACRCCWPAHAGSSI